MARRGAAAHPRPRPPAGFCPYTTSLSFTPTYRPISAFSCAQPMWTVSVGCSRWPSLAPRRGLGSSASVRGAHGSARTVRELRAQPRASADEEGGARADARRERTPPPRARGRYRGRTHELCQAYGREHARADRHKHRHTDSGVWPHIRTKSVRGSDSSIVVALGARAEHATPTLQAALPTVHRLGLQMRCVELALRRLLPSLFMFPREVHERGTVGSSAFV
eukprot:3850139-Pleurochrysis_carterae.AAC.2